MKLRQPNRSDPDVNLTPLIDVVFLLLIFFMVSTTFNRETAISVDLPEAASSQTEKKDINIEVTINASGQYFVNQKRVVNTQIDTLKRALEIVMEGSMDHSLIISADAATPHQAVITAMDAARQIGITHLSLSTKKSAN